MSSVSATDLGFLPAKDMSGYGPAGRGAIIPQKIPSQRILARKEFLYHLFILWKSIICQIYWDEWSSWGRCWWKWLFSLGKTRFALMFLMNSARPRSDFIYTKNSARPGSDYIYTKIAARPGSDFIYTKVFGAFLRFLNEKTAYILKHFPAAREFGQEIL